MVFYSHNFRLYQISSFSSFRNSNYDVFVSHDDLIEIRCALVFLPRMTIIVAFVHHKITRFLIAELESQDRSPKHTGQQHYVGLTSGPV
jgi:hypothetical protein